MSEKKLNGLEVTVQIDFFVMMSELPFDSFSKLDNYPFTQLLIYLHLKHNFQECFSFSAAIDPFDLRAQKTDLPLLSF